jgi:hypothetical protein
MGWDEVGWGGVEVVSTIQVQEDPSQIYEEWTIGQSANQPVGTGGESIQRERKHGSLNERGLSAKSTRTTDGEPKRVIALSFFLPLLSFFPSSSVCE